MRETSAELGIAGALVLAACQAVPAYTGPLDLGAAGATMNSRDVRDITEYIATGRDAHWQSHDIAYTLDVLRSYEARGTTCRDYYLYARVHGQQRIDVRASACRQADGSWSSRG